MGSLLRNLHSALLRGIIYLIPIIRGVTRDVTRDVTEEDQPEEEEPRESLANPMHE